MKNNDKEITKLVLKIKQGEDLWEELLTELTNHKEAIVNSYFRNLKKMCSKEDVIALYEDTLLNAISYFDSKKLENFMNFFGMQLSVAKKTIMRKSYQNKRIANWMDCTSANAGIINEGIVGEIQDTWIDGRSTQEFYDVEFYTSFVNILTKYKEESTKNNKYSKIIIKAIEVETLPFEIKVQEILEVFPNGTSWETARKAVQRAKKHFANYLIENNFLA